MFARSRLADGGLMATITQSPLEVPLPPATLKATDADLQALREVVQRLGWHETLA